MLQSRSAHALQLIALTGFAVAQPLYEVLSGNPEFFLASGPQLLDPLLAVVLLSFLFPALLMGVEAAVGRIVGRRALAWVHALFLFALLTAVALPPIGKTLPMTTALQIGMAMALGLVSAMLIARVLALRRFLTFSGPLALAFPILFIGSDSIRGLMFPADLDVFPVSDARHSVVVLVLDELPISFLLDVTGQLDVERYPGFGRLAEVSTWFPNAVTVSDYTHQALPAILSGRYPESPAIRCSETIPKTCSPCSGEVGSSRSVKV